MKLIILSTCFLLNINCVFSQDVKLVTQFINPCGGDGGNEFIVGQTLGTTVNVGNLAFSSAVNPSSPLNFNWFWSGKNVVTTPYPTFSSLTTEVCGNAGTALACFRLLDPGTPADATTINSVISTLNTIAGCNVFLAIPASGDIPPHSNFIVFLGAGGCGFDVTTGSLSGNVSFANHCSGGTPLTQYFVIVGNAGYSPASGCSGGYFSNSASRTSTLYNYTGGGNTIAANYQQSSSTYTPGSSPSSGNAGVMVPDGAGGSKWINNQGCVPGPLIILPVNKFELNVQKRTNYIELEWDFQSDETIKTFSVEKGVSPSSFKEIALLPQTKYNSDLIVHENYRDESLASTTIYYRIKAVTEKNNTYYSPVKIINQRKIEYAKVFPNPASNVINFSSYENQLIHYRVLSIEGYVIFSGSILNQTRKIDISQLPKGIYSINTYSKEGSFVSNSRFIKQ